MTSEEIINRLNRNFTNAVIELKDLAGDNDHYAVVVTAEEFRGKSRVAQHKMVYAALEGAMTNTLHALQVTTHIPKGE